MNIDPKDVNVQKWGGAFPVANVPEGLQVVQSGKSGHYVIAPSSPMTRADLQKPLDRVQLGDSNVIR